MHREHGELVVEQFGSPAHAYVASAVHAQGADLERLATLVEARPGSAVLDLGCGGGHVSYTVAPYAARVVAFDPSGEMLDAVSATAKERGFENVECRRGSAERFPFADRTFDFVFSRFSAHHWASLQSGLAEAQRVLADAGTAVFVDICSPGIPLLDTHLQAVELLRDRSHVRDYTAAEWHAACGAAGFWVNASTTERLRMEFASWTARMRTPQHLAEAVRELQRSAPLEVVSYFAVDATGSFTIDSLMLECRKALPR